MDECKEFYQVKAKLKYLEIQKNKATAEQLNSNCFSPSKKKKKQVVDGKTK